MQIGLLTALLGGALALLSPCSALLLPAFFAARVGARARLLLHGAVFYLGLVLVLVPLGLGLGALGSLLTGGRGLLIAATSILLVALGIAQMLGFGFDAGRLLPARLRAGAETGSGLIRTFLLGAVGGVAGFCAGPILGAILTLALAEADAWSAGALLAVYGAGMVVPLVIIAAAWQRLGRRGRRLLRGRAFTVFGRELHTTSVLTGALIIAVGLAFWFTNGLIDVPSLVPTDVQAWLQERGGSLAGPVVDVIAIAGAAIAGLVAWYVLRRRAARREAAELEPRSDGPLVAAGDADGDGDERGSTR